MSTIRQRRILITDVLLLVLLILVIIFSGWLAFFARPRVGTATPVAGEAQPVTYEPQAAKPQAQPPVALEQKNSGPSLLASAGVSLYQSGPAVNSLPGLPRLLIPVAGVKSEQLRDSFTDARSENRAHHAIDIMAARGTPVLAVENGTIKRIFYSERGGNTVYQMSSDKRWIYYYAHLDSYAGGLVVDKAVRQGEVLGYVGDTGNAGAGNCHLHFSIWKITDPKRFWDGENVNPYLLLR